MNKKFIVNHDDVTGYKLFITILDKDASIEEVSNDVFETFGIINEEILIDAAIIHGINNYRFVSAHPQGNFYVFPTEQEVERANDVLRSYPEKIKNTYYKLESEVENEPVKLYSMSYR